MAVTACACRGSRVYRVRQRSLFSAFKSNPNSLRVSDGPHPHYIRWSHCHRVAVSQKLVRHLVEAVASLSAVGIVHADIKPENVLLKFRVSDSCVPLPSHETAVCG